MSDVCELGDKDRHRRLISELEKARSSKVVAYTTSDRGNASGQIGDDAVRPLYDHFRSIGKVKKADLLIYSQGGSTDTPWRIVSLVREFAEEFAVLVPYRAMSAATMIALGADEIVMCPKGELGPIDPQLMQIQTGPNGESSQQEISVEDIMAYVRFLKDEVGLSDQNALGTQATVLTDKLSPQVLGKIYRAHSHIRSVARKLLEAHSPKFEIDGPSIDVIVDTLAEKTFEHGHAIGRREARGIGLNVIKPERETEDLIWNLFEEYESLFRLMEPLDPPTFVPEGKEEHLESLTLACIESLALAHHYTAEFKGRNQRSSLPQLNLNLNIQLQLPAEVKQEEIPPEMQATLQELVQQAQLQAERAVQTELERQAEVVGFSGRMQRAAWREVVDWTT